MSSNGHWQFNVLVGAATIYDKKFLVLKRSSRESFLPAVWGIPAGQIEEDEDPSDACRRELFEETGLHGQVREPIGYSTFSSYRGSMKLNNIQLNFLVSVTDSEVKLNPASHSEYEWISLDDVDNSELLDAFTRDIIKSARDALKDETEHEPVGQPARGYR